MNKQEAIETIKEEWLSEAGTSLQDITDTVNQIDELEKVVVPSFIGDWLKYCKETKKSLHRALSAGYAQANETDNWIYENQDRFAEAWLAYPNITVEKEKLYTVQIPNPNSGKKTMLIRRGKVVHLEIFEENYHTIYFALTKAEILKDFDWAWQFAKEVGGENIELSVHVDTI